MLSPEDEPAWLAGLNGAQREAVEHEGGPMLVVAGAGSGKTRTLAARVVRLLSRGADPDRVLLLTFSRRAAREMLRRAEHLGAERRSAGRVWGGTFHAIAHRLLRQHGRAVGLPPSFSILDRSDAADLMGVVRSELKLGEQGRRFPKKDTLLDIYSRVANAGERLTDTLAERFPWCHAEIDGIRAAFEGYTARKRDRALLDYDDLLLYWRALVTSSPGATLLQRRFDHVLVDEYQDTNALQAMATAYTTRAEFLAELIIDPPARTTDLVGPPLLDDDWLVLSTIHSAKGGEWTAVYVIHASDGNLPSDMALTGPEGVEEERRLLYVAVTRARDHLYVTYPMRYYDRRHGLDDVHALAQPSRFLATLTSLFDEPPPEVTAALLADHSTPAGPDRVGTELAALWT